MQPIDRGHLVRTGDGYYAIVESVANRTVFLANGLEQDLTKDEWALLQPLPLNIFGEDGSPANFLDLVEGRTPYQAKQERGLPKVRQC